MSIPNKYWSAVESFTVTAVEGFQVLVGAGWVAAENIAVQATANFTRYAALVVDQTIQVSGSASFTRMQQLVSAVQVRVSDSVTAVVGLAKFLVSSVYTGVVSAATASNNVAMVSYQSISASAAALFGKLVAFAATQPVQVQESAAASIFDEYAPAERAMVVPFDNTDSEVV